MGEEARDVREEARDLGGEARDVGKLTLPNAPEYIPRMLIRRFEVQGFRNLTEPVVLEGLGPLNMIHGENNVGKSNLLRAMGLFFRLLGERKSPFTPPVMLDDDKFFRTLGSTRSEAFNLANPAPIRLSATLETDAAELRTAGLGGVLKNFVIDIAVELVWFGSHTEYRIRRFSFDGVDVVAAADLTEKVKDNAHQVVALLAGNFRGSREVFSRVKVDRSDRESTEQLARALYEARDAVELPRVQQWDRFETAMESFADVLGQGRFSPRRPQDKYVLAFRTDTAMIPVHLLGSGVQQLVAMLGAILVPGAQIVAIEEPELHLKTTLQERLRDLLRTLPGSVGAPSQIFLTSHSPHFEVSDSFYFLSRKDAQSAPTVEKRPAKAASIVVGAHVPERHEGKFPTSWVSHEGVVRFAPRVMEHLGIVGGGAVVVEPAAEQGRATIEGEDRYLDRVGLHDEEA